MKEAVRVDNCDVKREKERERREERERESKEVRVGMAFLVLCFSFFLWDETRGV